MKRQVHTSKSQIEESTRVELMDQKLTKLETRVALIRRMYRSKNGNAINAAEDELRALKK